MARKRNIEILTRLLGALPWLTAVAFIGTCVAWLSMSNRIARDAYHDYSVYSTDDDGLSLAYAYLKRVSGEPGGPGSVMPLTRHVTRAGIEPDSVVFRIRPDPKILAARLADFAREQVRKRRDNDRDDEKKDEEEAEPEGDEERKSEGDREPEEDESPADDLVVTGILEPEEFAWVHGGGRIVLAVDADVGDLGIEAAPRRSEVTKVYPIWSGVRDLRPRTLRVMTGGPVGRMHAVFAVGRKVLLGKWILGAGDVIVMSCPDIFRNSSISNGDHLALIAALAGSGRSVYFDERIHGMHSSGGALDLLQSWGLGALVLVGVATGLLLLWRASVRAGPPETDRARARVEAVEFVDSLAELYYRALTRREAATLYYEAFSHEVAVRTGLRGEALEKKVKSLTTRRLRPGGSGTRDISRSVFRHLLRNLNAAFGRLSDVKRFK